MHIQRLLARAPRYASRPYADGQYRFLIANGAQAFDVPRDDGFQLPGVDVFPLRVRLSLAGKSG